LKIFQSSRKPSTFNPVYSLSFISRCLYLHVSHSEILIAHSPDTQHTQSTLYRLYVCAYAFYAQL